MISRHFYLRPDQLQFLENMPGNVSAHIRDAIDAYILKRKKENMPTTSPSKLSSSLRVAKGVRE